MHVKCLHGIGLTEISREHVSIQCCTHQDELQLWSRINTNNNINIIYIRTYVGGYELHVEGCFYLRAHQVLPLWKQISHDDGEEVRCDVPLVHFIHHNMRHLRQETRKIQQQIKCRLLVSQSTPPPPPPPPF